MPRKNSRKQTRKSSATRKKYRAVRSEDFLTKDQSEETRTVPKPRQNDPLPGALGALSGALMQFGSNTKYFDLRKSPVPFFHGMEAGAGDDETLLAVLLGAAAGMTFRETKREEEDVTPIQNVLKGASQGAGAMIFLQNKLPKIIEKLIKMSQS